MTEHTPGPWQVFPSVRLAQSGDRFGVQSRGGLLVADCGLVENAHSLANARITAAALDLLVALEKIVLDWDGEPEDMFAAKQAIAKARGREAI